MPGSPPVGKPLLALSALSITPVISTAYSSKTLNRLLGPPVPFHRSMLLYLVKAVPSAGLFFPFLCLSHSCWLLKTQFHYCLQQEALCLLARVTHPPPGCSCSLCIPWPMGLHILHLQHACLSVLVSNMQCGAFFRFYLFMRDIERGRDTSRGRSRLPTDLRTLGPHPGPKANAQPLSHPGIPAVHFSTLALSFLAPRENRRVIV